MEQTYLPDFARDGRLRIQGNDVTFGANSPEVSNPDQQQMDRRNYKPTARQSGMLQGISEIDSQIESENDHQRQDKMNNNLPRRNKALRNDHNSSLPARKYRIPNGVKHLKAEKLSMANPIINHNMGSQKPGVGVSPMKNRNYNYG